MAGRALIVLVMLLAMAGVAHAQEKGQVGLVIGYPASAGIIWHLSERMAFRPDVTLTRSTNDQTNFIAVPGLSTTTSSGESWQVTAGLSALFYVHRRDALRTYISPRFAYTRSTSTSTSSSPLPTGSTMTSESVFAQYAFVGSFGVQYALGRSFSIFGEIGAAYTDIESSTSLASTRLEGTNRVLSTRSGVGVVLYF